MNWLIKYVVVRPCKLPNCIHILFIIVFAIPSSSLFPSLFPCGDAFCIIYSALIFPWRFTSMHISGERQWRRVSGQAPLKSIHRHFLHQGPETCLSACQISTGQLAIIVTSCSVCTIREDVLKFLSKGCLLLRLIELAWGWILRSLLNLLLLIAHPMRQKVLLMLTQGSVKIVTLQGWEISWIRTI